MTQVICNECEQEFKLPKLKRNVLEHLVYEYYFHCSECGHKYISYYTDKQIRHRINKQKKQWELYGKVSKDKARQMLADLTREDKRIKQLMDNLHEKMTADD